MKWVLSLYLLSYSRCSSHRITQASSPALAFRNSMNCVGKVGLCEDYHEAMYTLSTLYID